MVQYQGDNFPGPLFTVTVAGVLQPYAPVLHLVGGIGDIVAPVLRFQPPAARFRRAERVEPGQPFGRSGFEHV